MRPPVANIIDRVEQMLEARKPKVKSFIHPLTKVHAMDLFDLKHNFLRIYDYVKSSVPALRPLARLVPGPNERIPMYQTKFMPDKQVANLCFLLENFSELLTEKINVQELAEISGEDYISMYRLHLGDRTDSSILLDFQSRKLPQAPKRIILRGTNISSYWRSLGSIKFFSTKKVQLGRTIKRNRPKKVIRIKGAPVFGRVVPKSTRDKSPEI